MWWRLLVGTGLFALGYYLGKEVERTRPVRDELDRARAARTGAEDDGTPGYQDREDAV
ncbi:MAG: hypothetical protein RLZ44_1368 [Pseudomonadota bacterium]|jgi:hypothetical protein